jgi:3',5'-cyclic AMP phosphodiesterase CpdA
MGRLCLAAAVAGAFLCAGPAGAATGILAIGDFGVGGQVERDMGTSIRRFEAHHPADALVTLGDNDYTESPSRFHTNWTGAFGWLGAAGVTPAGSLGNHDWIVNHGRYEYDELAMPRASYRRRLGDLELFILNSNRVGDRQTARFARWLEASTATWKIAVFHHPPYTCGGHSGDEAVQRRWVPLFERWDVDLVLSGHDHNYQRFRAQNGVRYVVDGGGGAPLYALNACPAGYPRRVVGRAVHGFLFLRLRADGTLVLRAFTARRREFDRLVLYP